MPWGRRRPGGALMARTPPPGSLRPFPERKRLLYRAGGVPHDVMASRGLREAVAAAAVVALVFGLLTLWSGVWPPLVVIESGSMMHQEGCLDPGDRDDDGDRECTPYGRFGTMDPGDIVAVKKASARQDIELLVEAGEPRFGLAGDVIVYYRNNDTSKAPVIHRAVAWINVIGEGPDRRYTVDWIGRERLHFSSAGVYLPEFGLDERYGYPKERAFKPIKSGFITRGDNPLTNPASDQALGISGLVEPGWIVGKARFELPWFGLIKLALANSINQEKPPIAWVRIGNAFAPADLWIMLGVVLGVLLSIPVVVDIRRAWKERQRDRADEERRRQAEGRPPAG